MSFCIKTHNGIERIHLKQVLYFAAKHKHVTLYYKWGAVLLNDTLVALEKEFGHYLLRIHRNTLVVRHRLLRLENQPTGAICVYLKDCSDALLVSRRHAPLVRRAMQ
ncbi:UNVERIFIED_CONTAM: hypothetical protein GTU68_060420 [Idotea baltica]|nr:hypothetical protein [Idotea baltica]